ncbi:L-2-hydroxycarboxylate dehydrogenase (NAD+) [Sodalis ligni]|uniref:L-2-hydroxycarboxylate dehydrogenase (NAD+) n=2 Tax=Sodalis ligni TaxID=2697027 RepID=A0A4R1NDZ9_9GAMM|nr:L-2-hydroxycarboxylate dehydrogenase (NAD+) [Sodalis ligni]
MPEAMAHMDMSNIQPRRYHRIGITVLTGFIKDIFIANGCSESNAQIMANVCIEADLRGHSIQGIDHIYSILRDLANGVLIGDAAPRVISDTGATLLIDGAGCPGYVGGVFAAEQLIEKTRRMGTASAALQDAGDLFMLGYYAEQFARAGLIGLVFTNTWPPRVHPAGGIDPILGTNPLAIGIPTGAKPIVFDSATSTSAIGHVRLADYHGEKIAPGIALDADGVPTTDPGEALQGALTPMAGHKGFGLGLCIALLSGAMAGGELGSRLDIVARSNDRSLGKRSHLFIAIDPAAFGDPTVARSRADTYLSEIKAGRRMPGVDEILMPGERSARARTNNLGQGVPILAEVWDRICRFAADADVAIPSVTGER